MRFVLLMGIPLLCAGCNQTTGSTSPPPVVYSQFRELTPAEQTALGVAFARTLKDPDAAKFRWTKLPIDPTKKDQVTYCASVNAKNSYGAYTGFKPFLSMVFLKDGRAVGGAMIGDGSDIGNQVAENMCKQQGLNPYAAA